MTCSVSCEIFDGMAQVRDMDSLPEPDVDLILGNDLVRSDAVTPPVVTKILYLLRIWRGRMKRPSLFMP